MDKASETFKKPWVPPPGKASKKKKASSKPMDKSKKNIEITVKPTASVTDISSPTFADLRIKHWDYNTNSSRPMANHFSKETKIEEIYLSLQRLKNDGSNFQSTRDTFRDVLDVLHRSAFILTMEDLTVNQMISQSDLLVNQYFDIFNEFENRISSSDYISRHNTDELIEHVNEIHECKERLHAKLLHAYNCITSTLKFIIEIMLQEQFSTLFKDYNALKDRMESLQNSFLEREAIIKQLEYELHQSQQKVCMLEKEKKCREPANQSSGKRVIKSKADIYTSSDLHSYKPDLKLIAENASILKGYADIKRMAEAEITALKKALAIRKTSLDHYQFTANQLQEKLKEKEKEILKLGLERDDWKSKLTIANNKLVETEYQIEHLKNMNRDLEKELNSLKESHKVSLTQLETTVNEKSIMLDEVTNENTKLSEAFSNAKEQFSASQNEIKSLQEKYSTLEAKLEAQINCAKNVKIDSGNEMYLIIPLLQELKDCLTAVREKGFQSTKDSGDKVKEKLSEGNLLGLVKEIKNLIESKEVHQNSLEQNIANQQLASVENKFQVLREKCDREIAEKEKRLEQLKEQLKIADTKYSTHENSTINMNSSLLNLEGERKRTSDLEEELRNKSYELTTIKRQQVEDRNKFESEVRDLKIHLTRITTNYENLQKYVNMLKSSYSNVFGSS